MCCILPVMHSDALLCIPVHLGGKIPISMSAGARLTRFMMLKNAHECTWMHKNASECTRIHQGPHTYLHKRSRSGLKAKLTWTDKACHKSTQVPSKSSSNAYTSEHTRVNASAYTSECVCEWMHLNALECVRMRVRQNATCRQNAPYVGRHTNAFECNSCRMQRTANAQ